MTNEERAQLAAYVVRDLLRLTDDVGELGLPATRDALRGLTHGFAVATGTEIKQ